MFKEKVGNIAESGHDKNEEEKINIQDNYNLNLSVAEAADNFYNLKSEKELDSLWYEKYDKNPTSFFNDDNFEYLSSLEVAQRLNLMAIAATSIKVGPQMAEKYFQKFPHDLLVVNKVFEFVKFEGLNRRNYHLFTISALQMDKKNLTIENDESSYARHYGDLAQFYDIALRRQEAPKLLLSNFSDLSLKDDFAEFGSAANDLFEAVDESSKNYCKLDTSKIFSGEFKNLTEDQKSLFLRKCLAYFQYFLLFEETFNSCFTKESVEFFDKGLGNHYNVAHSMIFKSYQPSSVYNYNKEYFDSEMDWTEEKGGAAEEYAHHKLVLATLDEFKDVNSDRDENTKLLVDFWNKNRNPMFIDYVSTALSKQNVNLAASELLKLLKTEKEKKEPIEAMLYRLEFGQIGISEQGVKYLEKFYDLGEYNKPEFHASRLTANGEMGVFNEDLELIKYFHLGSLDSDEKTMKADILDFTYHTLFIGNKHESAKEREVREGYLDEFKKKYYQVSQNELFKSTGIQLNNLSFKEQGWFLIFFNQADAEEKKRLHNFVDKYREKGIKAFLSMETNQDLGNQIISIGEKLDKDSGLVVFSKIEEIVRLVEAENQELKDLFLINDENFNFDWHSLRLNLLKKIEVVISNFNNEIENGGDQKNINRLLKSLSKTRLEIILLSSILKTAKENKQDIDLETIKDLDLRVKDYGEEITNKEREEILNIARANWSDFGNLKMADVVLAGLEESLADDKNQRAYILKYKDDVIGFVRFKKTDHGAVYAGSFNVSKDLRGLSIGNDMMEKALMKEAENNILEAAASIKIPAGCSYVEKVGFVADGLIKNYHNTGESLFNIKLDKKNNKNYSLRSEGKEKSFSTNDLKEDSKSYKDLDNIIGREFFVLRFDLNKEMDDYQETLSKLLARTDENGRKLEGEKNKYTLTRYFYDKEESPDGNIRYLAFEKNH